MKLITAIVQPDKLDAVREALLKAQITRITVCRVTGHGRQRGEETLYRGELVAPTLIPKIQIDIACNDDAVRTACEAIIQAARHGGGKIGDGKIFVTSLEECIRIRTGESGDPAL